MKKTPFALISFVFAFLFLGASLTFAADAEKSTGNAPTAGKTLNVLTVGNSFSICLERYFPDVVRSVPGCDVHLETIYIGGCSLERHWNNIATEEADPEKRHFKEFTYRQKFESRDWDVVSIQQSSPLSWKPESFFPFAEDLTNYIRKYAPNAEVVIQQTWAYRSDEKRLENWKIDQKTMFEKLTDAYSQAADRLALRVVPMGLAVQKARETQAQPETADQATSFCGPDAYHLNRRGEYLQACVWFAILFERPATDVTFVPEGFSPEDAKFLREAAQKAVEEYRQTEKLAK